MFASKFSESDFLDGGLPITFFLYSHTNKSDKMGRELQKKKNRSSVSKVTQKAKSKKKLLQNPVIAANWYACRTALLYAQELTVSQESKRDTQPELPPPRTRFQVEGTWRSIKMKP